MCGVPNRGPLWVRVTVESGVVNAAWRGPGAIVGAAGLASVRAILAIGTRLSAGSRGQLAGWRRYAWLLVGSASGLFLAMMVPAMTILAATVSVTTTADATMVDGAVSLREAIASVNNGAD